MGDAMWTCDVLKKRAAATLSPIYWWSVLAVLIYSMILSVSGSVLSVLESLTAPFYSLFAIFLGRDSLKDNPSIQEIIRFAMPVITFSAVLFLLLFLLVNGFAVFFQNPLYCGLMKWFCAQREKKDPRAYQLLFTAFNRQRYRHITAGMAWRLLWMTLWSAAAAIPFVLPAACAVVFAGNADGYIYRIAGKMNQTRDAAVALVVLCFILLYIIALILSLMIIMNRSYAYFYVPFLLVDEPEIGFREAIKKSIRMSGGQKGRMFLLDLSFIGWWILVMMTCGIGAIFLLPYIMTTYTELYFTRKAELTDPIN